MLPSQRDVFGIVVPGHEYEWVLGTEIRDWRRDSITGDAKPAYHPTVFIKRNAARRAIKGTTTYRLNREHIRPRQLVRARRWAEQNHAFGSSEFVDVGKKQI